MRKLIRRGSVALAGIAALVALSACDGPPTEQDKDAKRSDANVSNLIANQPVEKGKWSPTREQINNWIRTWQSGPGKLAYVYLFNQGSNQPVGYYILIGPPVSYAAGATQTYRVECHGSTSCVVVPRAAQDGAFYNTGSGGTQWYGKDATTGRQLEWGGTGVWYLLSDQPLRLDAPPLGDAEIGKVKPGQGGR